jgi:hypothetical protein
MLDYSNPTEPEEIGFYIPEPAAGEKATQSNDVFVDENELVYVIDRNAGLEIIEPLV